MSAQEDSEMPGQHAWAWLYPRQSPGCIDLDVGEDVGETEATPALASHHDSLRSVVTSLTDGPGEEEASLEAPPSQDLGPSDVGSRSGAAGASQDASQLE
eukprot:3061863-Alexandrium_andersonii.AAC.1